MRYFTKRPAGPGCQPTEGLLEILPGEQQDWLPMYVYNVLVYDRELTRKEVRDYELAPDYPPVEYKGYTLDFLPYTWEWAILDPDSVEPSALAYCDSLEEAQKLVDEHPLPPKQIPQPPKRKRIRKPF